MAKLYTGIDIGSERLKMAVCGDQGVVSVAIEEVPESLVKDGRVTSFETMAEVIRDAARKNKINAKDCALALHSRDSVHAAHHGAGHDGGRAGPQPAVRVP